MRIFIKTKGKQITFRQPVRSKMTRVEFVLTKRLLKIKIMKKPANYATKKKEILGKKLINSKISIETFRQKVKDSRRRRNILRVIKIKIDKDSITQIQKELF